MLWRLLPLVALVSCGQPAPPSWQIVFQGLTSGLTSVWGTSENDVWAVGSDAGDGKGPLVIHHDGAGFRRVPTGAEGDLWWVHGFVGGPIFFGGDNGLILRLANGRFEIMETPGTNTVTGIWGVSPADLWAVGATLPGEERAFAWHFDGNQWRDVPLPVQTRALWKVYGRAANDVWMVGAGGTILHHDGTGLAPVPSGTEDDLFTIHGSGTTLFAVGGLYTGTLLENTGGANWVNVTPPTARRLIGVCASDQYGWAVGMGALVFQREATGWRQVSSPQLPGDPMLHAVWVDPAGGVWAVGGHLVVRPLHGGVLLHRGRAFRSPTID